MKVTGQTKFVIAIIVTCLVLIGGASLLLSHPTPILNRSDLLPAQTATEGNPNARVYLVEFSDFQCPACGAYKPFVDQVVEKYKDKIIFGYRHFPLPQHKFAFSGKKYFTKK